MTGARLQEDPRAVVERLARRPELQRALAWVERNVEGFVEELVALSQIAAPTFAEGPRGEHVARRFEQLGLRQIHTDAAGNVIGLLGDAAGRGSALVAHLDTVFGPETDVSVTRRERRLYGPGTGDNGAGVAGVLQMLAAMQAGDVRLLRPLWVVASTGEEGLGDLRGVRAAVQDLGEHFESVVAVEGALLGRVTHQGVGSRRWRVLFRGPGGHSWHDFGRPSAVSAACSAAAQIGRLSVPPAPRTTFNVGRIEGGTGVNVIAAEASLLLDMRSVDERALNDLARQAESALRQAARQEGVEIQIESVGERPAGAIPRESSLVQTAAAVLRWLGLEPRFDAASTDANIPLSRGLPAVTVGVTHGGGVHTEGEWIEIQPAVQGISQLLLLTAALTEAATPDRG